MGQTEAKKEAAEEEDDGKSKEVRGQANPQI